MLNIPTIDSDLVKAIPWTGDSAQYDLDLFALGQGLDKFFIVNSDTIPNVYEMISEVPDVAKCVVWKNNGEWVVKCFRKDWTPDLGYTEINFVPKLLWRKNPDLDQTMTFEDNPFAVYKPDLWDSRYELVWYMDPRFNPGPEKVWVMSCRTIGVGIEGTKDMGYITPKVKVEFNEDLPKLDIDIDQCYPPYWDLVNECAWELDPIHIPEKRTWVVKFSPAYRKPKAWVWYGIITPEFVVEYNPDLPKINYTGNHVVPWYDLAYEHVWYLEENKEKIWAIKARAVENVVGVKDMGNLLLDIAQLDVVFISYDEPNAEENWQRVLEKSPHAKRVNGVTGIFEAHKAAAKLAKTDMFYVVDGDAYLVDEWQFDYQPEIFDRDCAYVWHSKNPINDLEYGYGGVKLFPRRAFSKIKVWKTLDLLTTIVPKLKVIDEVSNITAFNTDEFATWRSAFRETIKLCRTIAQDPNNTEAIDRLSAWETLGADRPFGDYAQSAVTHAREFFEENNNVPTLQQINNRSWLHTMFKSKKLTAFDYKPIKIVKKEDVIAVVTNTNTICAVPWMHLAFEPSGKVIPCCLTSVHNYFAGDLTHQSIEEIWNSGNMKTLRKDMIEGKEPEICRKCFDRERVTGESGRFYHNRDFPEVLEKIPKITLKDGTCITMELKYWDFRFSNLCNFKCRSCGPRYSSAWVPDAKKLGLTDQEKIWNIDSVDDKTNFDFLKDQVDHVERIYFAGGEPLIMPEHWQILEMLADKKRFDVKLSYNTNASVLTYGKKNVIDYWRQWQWGKLEIWPSIDEVGERAELIRAGTVWSKVEANLIELMSLDNAIVRPGITVGAWNVGRFPEIIEHLISIGVVRKHPKTDFINYNNFFINLLEHPLHYHVSILPDDYRAATVRKLESWAKDHNEKYGTNIDHLLTHIIHELKKPFDLESAKKFVTVTDRLDTLRGENTYEVIPEMNLVLEATRNNEHGQD